MAEGLLVFGTGGHRIRAVHTQMPADAATLASTPITAKNSNQPELNAAAVCVWQEGVRRIHLVRQAPMQADAFTMA